MNFLTVFRPRAERANQRWHARQRPSAVAFTLIELLIVVAIIAILAAIAVPNFLEAQTRAKVSRAKSDMRALAVPLEAYYVDHNEYPFHADPAYANTYEIPWLTRLIDITTPIAYITSIPEDPFRHEQSGGSSIGVADDPLYQCYVYCRQDVRIIIPPSLPDLGDDGWMLNSAGPDANIESQSFYTADEIILFESIGITLLTPAFYDPTNGTMSQGDVFRWNTDSHENAR